MSSAIENEARLSGSIRSRRPHPSVPRWDILGVDVESVDALPGSPDLLSQRIGQRIDIAVDRTTLPEGPLHDRQFSAAVRLVAPDLAIAVPGSDPVVSPTL